MLKCQHLFSYAVDNKGLQIRLFSFRLHVTLFCFAFSAQEQQDQSYAASIQYQPGDKCFVSKTKKH